MTTVYIYEFILNRRTYLVTLTRMIYLKRFNLHTNTGWGAAQYLSATNTADPQKRGCYVPEKPHTEEAEPLSGKEEEISSGLHNEARASQTKIRLSKSSLSLVHIPHFTTTLISAATRPPSAPGSPPARQMGSRRRGGDGRVGAVETGRRVREARRSRLTRYAFPG